MVLAFRVDGLGFEVQTVLASGFMFQGWVLGFGV